MSKCACFDLAQGLPRTHALVEIVYTTDSTAVGVEAVDIGDIGK